MGTGEKPGSAVGRGGGLVISLDFELMWGVRDMPALAQDYVANVLGTRDAVPRILDLLSAHQVGGTWATVGGLFASSKEEFAHYAPALLPSYDYPRLSPYADLAETSRNDERLYFAPELVDEIAARPQQELASHTFSHYYCLEPGQTLAQFEADLASTIAIAAAKGRVLTSMVFPRNQVNEHYLPSLSRHGFTAYRGTEGHFFGRPHATSRETLFLRGMRMLDSLVAISGSGTARWSTVASVDGLSNVKASRFLRPAPRSEILRSLMLRRVLLGMEHAARTGEIYHLWWHPHNFGSDLDANLSNLSAILEQFARLHGEYGFGSYTMNQLASICWRECAAPNVWRQEGKLGRADTGRGGEVGSVVESGRRSLAG